MRASGREAQTMTHTVRLESVMEANTMQRKAAILGTLFRGIIPLPSPFENYVKPK